jgi:hypothetical protein
LVRQFNAPPQNEFFEALGKVSVSADFAVIRSEESGLLKTPVPALRLTNPTSLTPPELAGPFNQIIHVLGGKESLTEKLFDALPESVPPGGLMYPHD